MHTIADVVYWYYMKSLITILILIIIVVAGYFGYRAYTERTVTDVPAADTTIDESGTATPEEDAEQDDMTDIPTDGEDDTASDTLPATTVLGASAGGNSIVAHHYGSGDTEVLFVGGIHGGYSWNTTLVAYEIMDYLERTPRAVPENIRVTVIPTLNPDGIETVFESTERFSAADAPESQSATVPGRFNSNDVDLNRNFDCDWQAQAVWQDNTVSGGSAPFSEPESEAFRAYVAEHTPAAVIVYYSSAGGVYSSSCYNGVLEETKTLTSLYADASGYPAYEEFDFYQITGDMVNWLAKEGYPAISVLLATHTDTEWNKNKQGVEAILNYYSQ